MKKLSLIIVSLCLVFVVGFAGYRGYCIWSQKKLLRMTHEFIKAGDVSNAMLSLRNLLEINPHNVDGCRYMADFAELAHSPQAIEWRQRVVDVEPNSISNRLALIQTAIAFSDMKTAQKAFDAVPAADKKSAVCQQLAGVLDLTSQHLDLAEAHFREAARLEPTNPVPQLDVALVELQMRDPAAIARGRAALQSLAANPVVRVEALRQLAQDAVQSTNLTRGLGYSRELIACTNAVFGDRLRHLELLRLTGDAGKSAFLKNLQAEAVGNPANANDLGRWLLANTKPETALAWLVTLPPVTRTNLPVPLLETDCRMALKDWTGLTTSLTGQNWGRLECMRLACRARAYKELGQMGSAKGDWILALKASDNQAPLLQELMAATTEWKWDAEQEDILWAVVNHYPDQAQALQMLATRLYSGGRTSALMGLYGQALRTYPNSLELKNNLAMTALLLEAWEKKPHDLARDDYNQCPTNATYISTYAYSQLLQKHPADALKLMQQIPAAELERPGLALYYGVILTATGDRAKARHYLDLAAAGTLLPEEQKLIAAAMRR